MLADVLRPSILAVKLKIPGLIALSMAVLAALTIQVPLLNHSQLDMALRDATHALLFGLLTLGWLRFLQPDIVISRWMMLALLLLALCAELIESLVYNDLSPLDLSGNLLGVLLGYFVWKLMTPDRKAAAAKLLYLLAITTILSATVIVPVSIALHRAISQDRWYPVLLDPDMQAARPEVASLAADRDAEISWSDDGLHIRLLGDEIPGVVLTDFVGDWTGHTQLVIDAENPSLTEFRFEMHIRDRQGTADWTDRFNFERTLAAGSRTELRIPLKDIERAPADRTLDLSQITVIAIYSGAETSDSIILHRIGLE